MLIMKDSSTDFLQKSVICAWELIEMFRWCNFVIDYILSHWFLTSSPDGNGLGFFQFSMKFWVDRILSMIKFFSCSFARKARFLIVIPHGTHGSSIKTTACQYSFPLLSFIWRTTLSFDVDLFYTVVPKSTHLEEESFYNSYGKLIVEI